MVRLRNGAIAVPAMAPATFKSGSRELLAIFIFYRRPSNKLKIGSLIVFNLGSGNRNGNPKNRWERRLLNRMLKKLRFSFQESISTGRQNRPVFYYILPSLRERIKGRADTRKTLRCF